MAVIFRSSSRINAALKPFLALSTVQKASAGLTNIIVRLIARAWPYQLKMITRHDENVSTQCGAEAGMKPDTVVTALADGACNCWSVILSLPSLPTTALHLGLVSHR